MLEQFKAKLEQIDSAVGRVETMLPVNMGKGRVMLREIRDRL